jgi:hypothetical protein
MASMSLRYDVVPPHPRLLVEEGQARGGVVDEERAEKPLCVAVQLQRLRLPPRGQDPVERRGSPLQLVDAPRLLAALVHGQDETAVEKLLVHVHGRGGEEDHQRPFDPYSLVQATRGGVLAGGAIDSSPSDWRA